MSSEQPKLNNSEIENNSTSGEQETRRPADTQPSNEAIQSSSSRQQAMTTTNRAQSATSTLDNCSISSNRNKRRLKKAKSFAAPSSA